MPKSLIRAELLVYVKGGTGDLKVTGATGTWSERKITFKNAPRSAGPTVESAVHARGWTATDVTSLIGFTRSVDFVVAPAASARMTIESRESHARAPRLVIDVGDPVVGAAGDVACDPANPNFNGSAGSASSCHMRATANLLLSSRPTSVLPLGDLQYENGALPKFRASYDATWGGVNAVVHPAVGNHEYLTRNADGYFRYFGSAAGDPTKGYYSFDVGRWHLVALNSNCSRVGGCDEGSAQEAWLRSDLAAHRAAVCTLAFWHHPRFSSGGHGNTASMQAIWQTLYEFNADVVLSGHDHDYERFAPQRSGGSADADAGIRQFVVGTGGRNLTRFSRNIRPNSEVRNADAFGILKLTLRPRAYDWRFLPEPGKSFTDSGTAPCH